MKRRRRQPDCEHEGERARADRVMGREIETATDHEPQRARNDQHAARPQDLGGVLMARDAVLRRRRAARTGHYISLRATAAAGSLLDQQVAVGSGEVELVDGSERCDLLE